MNRADRQSLIEQLAPQSPACFDSRSSWVEWLHSADEAHKGADPADTSPLVISGGKVWFNTSINFCADCTASHREAMRSRSRCKPGCLQSIPQEAMA